MAGVTGHSFCIDEAVDVADVRAKCGVCAVTGITTGIGCVTGTGSGY